ncbi:uncharacterized protein [Mytilus edulis]|uniref:uncharacterized protein isoform X1 n=1 Tax=Mytilus edulis TaxID=6550 RepID=UPI0039EFB8E6
MATEIDMITKKPRTARDPYTTLTDTQIGNLKKDPSAFFMTSKPEKAYPDKGWTLDRYATCTNEHLFRGHLSQPHCWIDTQWQRDPAKDHNNSILGASQRWGPDKVGVRTVQHFNRPEDPNRFVNTELYRRQNTNRPGTVHMKHGRPGEGYYLMRNPNSQTWFGSTVPLNRTGILQDIRPKTIGEYEAIRNQHKSEVLERKGKYPAYSEYTDSIGLKTKLVPIMTTDAFTPELFVRRQRRKMYLEGEV